MGLLDLNSCTARQLTDYARIGKSLADSIIRYRRCFGGYKHIDELWKITGISRASYRNLQQYFYVEGQTVPAMGERLPNAKVAITESMLQMLTNEHLAEQREKNKTSGSPEPNKRVPQESPAPGGFTRTVRSANQGKSEEWQLSSNDNVERAKSSPNTRNTPNCHDIQSKIAKCEALVGDTILEMDGKITSGLAVPALETKPDNKVNKVLLGKDFKKAWDGSKAPEDFKVEAGAVASGPVEEGGSGPSVVLRASSSGNNINFSCTFDKNLLISEKPVALKFKSEKNNQKLQDVKEEDTEELKDEATKNPKKRTTIANKRTKSSKVCTTKSNHAQNDPENEENKIKSPRKRELQLLVDDDEDSFVVDFTKDNLDYLTAEKRFGATKQRKVIEAWVEDVNEHIIAGTLACTEEKVLSAADKSQTETPASGPIRKHSPANDKRSAKQPVVSWQLKTKNLTLVDRPSTSGAGKTIENTNPNPNIQPGTVGVSNYDVSCIWSKLRDIASTPFKGLYDNRLDDLPPPTAPAMPKPKKISPKYSRPTYRLATQDITGGSVKRRHNEKKMPPLHDSGHQGIYPSSSSSGRLPRKSAKGSLYVSENLSHNSGASWSRGHRYQQISPSSKRWAESSQSRAFKYSPSPMLSEKNASKSWRDMQVQLLQKRLKQMRSSSSQSPRRKSSQKYVLSPEARRSHKFV